MDKQPVESISRKGAESIDGRTILMSLKHGNDLSADTHV
jgi:hypothetical protein